MRATVYVEIVPERSTFNPRVIRAISVGRTWKREPTKVTLTPGAIVARIDLEVPDDRLQHVVTAVIPPVAPIGGR